MYAMVLLILQAERELKAERERHSHPQTTKGEREAFQFGAKSSDWKPGILKAADSCKAFDDYNK